MHKEKKRNKIKRGKKRILCCTQIITEKINFSRDMKRSVIGRSGVKGERKRGN